MMTRYLSALGIAISLTSCTINTYEGAQPNHQVNQPTRIYSMSSYNKPQRVQSAASAVRYGNVVSTREQMAKKGIPVGGGIRAGQAVVLPSKLEWGEMAKRAGTTHVEIQLKSIFSGQSIAQANSNPAEGKTRLVEGYIPWFSFVNDDKRSACKVVVDRWGQPVTIRATETGINRYAFYHHINGVTEAYAEKQKQVKTVKTKLQEKRDYKRTLDNSLKSNRAYQNGQCVLLRQRPVPPAPKRPNPEQVKINAHGACVNLLGSRFSEQEVVNALESSGRWDITTDYRKWILGSKMSCAAGVTVSDFDNLLCRGIKKFFPNLGKDYINSCIRDGIQECANKVTSRCDNGYNTWLYKRNKIINEPAKLQSQCKSDIAALAKYSAAEVLSLEQKLKTLEVEKALAFEQQVEFTRDTYLPFSDKRTYCQ